jgi:hypothetical protein
MLCITPKNLVLFVKNFVLLNVRNFANFRCCKTLLFSFEASKIFRTGLLLLSRKMLGKSYDYLAKTSREKARNEKIWMIFSLHCTLVWKNQKWEHLSGVFADLLANTVYHTLFLFLFLKIFCFVKGFRFCGKFCSFLNTYLFSEK